MYKAQRFVGILIVAAVLMTVIFMALPAQEAQATSCSATYPTITLASSREYTELAIRNQLYRSTSSRCYYRGERWGYSYGYSVYLGSYSFSVRR